MIDYKLKIISLACDQTSQEFQNKVIRIAFELSALDARGLEQKVYQLLPLQEPNATNYTPFEQLSEAQVISWIESANEGNFLKDAVAGLEEFINKINNPPIVDRIPPWVAN